MENLLLPLELKKSLDADSQRRALDILQQVGLEDRSASYPDRLSGGEQQRVAICRALIHNPLVLLADEPTGNLDAESGREVLTLLDQLIRKNRMTALMVTHSTEVSRLADRVITIKDGRLVETAASTEAVR
jgi:putative ABC transport system ATP-binding protein